MAALHEQGRSFSLRSVRKVKPDLAVASVAIGPVGINAIWISNIKSKPEIAWPQSGRGYPLFSIEDDLRDEIETAITDVISGWRLA
jgi:hypothetical protein